MALDAKDRGEDGRTVRHGRHRQRRKREPEEQDGERCRTAVECGEVHRVMKRGSIEPRRNVVRGRRHDRAGDGRRTTVSSEVA